MSDFYSSDSEEFKGAEHEPESESRIFAEDPEEKALELRKKAEAFAQKMNIDITPTLPFEGADIEESWGESDVEEFEEENAVRSTAVPHLDLGSLNALREENLEDRLESFTTPVAAPKSEPKESVKSVFINGYRESSFLRGAVRKVDVKGLKENHESNLLQGEDLVDLRTADVVKVPKETKAKFINDLGTSIESLKNLLLNDVAPAQLSFTNAFDEAHQILENIIDADVDVASTGHVRAMISDLIKLKVFRHVAKSLKIPKADADTVVFKYFNIHPNREKEG